MVGILLELEFSPVIEKLPKFNCKRDTFFVIFAIGCVSCFVMSVAELFILCTEISNSLHCFFIPPHCGDVVFLRVHPHEVKEGEEDTQKHGDTDA